MASPFITIQPINITSPNQGVGLIGATLPEMTSEISSASIIGRLDDVCSWSFTLGIDSESQKGRKILNTLTLDGAICIIKVLEPDFHDTIFQVWGIVKKVERGTDATGSSTINVSGRCIGDAWEQTIHHNTTITGHFFNNAILSPLTETNNSVNYINSSNNMVSIPTAIGKWIPTGVSPVATSEYSPLYTTTTYTNLPFSSVPAGSHSLLRTLQRGVAGNGLRFYFQNQQVVIFKPSGTTATFNADNYNSSVIWELPKANSIVIVHQDTDPAKATTQRHNNELSIGRYGLVEKIVPSTAPTTSDFTPEEIQRFIYTQGQLALLEDNGAEGRPAVRADIEVPYKTPVKFGKDWKLGDFVGLTLSDGRISYTGASSLLVAGVSISYDTERGISFRAGLGWKPFLKAGSRTPTGEEQIASVVSPQQESP